jgi:hypothetical protein
MPKKMDTKSVGSDKELGVTKDAVLRPEERVQKCGEIIHAALKENGCQLFAALKIGNAESVLVEIGGLPIVVKLGIVNDSSANGTRP